MDATGEQKDLKACALSGGDKGCGYYEGQKALSKNLQSTWQNLTSSNCSFLRCPEQIARTLNELDMLSNHPYQGPFKGYPSQGAMQLESTAKAASQLH